MDAIKLTASQATIKLFDDCMGEFSLWHYDAINMPLLLSGLIETDKAFLREYLIEEKGREIIEAFDIFLPIYCSNHMNELKINSNDSNIGKNQKQESKEELSDHTSDNKDDKKLDNDELASESVKDKETLLQRHEADSNSQYIVIKVKNNKIENIDIPCCDSCENITDEKEEEEEEEIEQYKSEHDSDITFREIDGTEHCYPVSKEFMNLIDVINKMSMEFGFTIIEPAHFTIAMFKTELHILKEFFRDLGIDFLDAKKFFSSSTVLNLGVIPFDLLSFMRCLNEDVDISKPCDILMRDTEVNKIWNICHKMTKRNVVIVGEAGVGKSALIEKITYDIVAGKCPERFKNFSVISLDVNSLIAGTSYRGDAEERIKEVIKFLESHDKVILFIDEVHTILGAGSCFEGEMDLANALKPILARGKTIVIGATTEKEYEAYFAQDAALSRRFEKVVVEEPESEKVYAMIANKVKVLSEFHNVKISKKMVEYIIMISNCFNFEKKNPDKTLDLIDRSLVSAETRGKKRVDKNDVLSNYDIYFEKFASMSKEAKMETAYHEVGHYLFAKLSDKLIDYKLLAVSIMPAERYLGITCYEERKDVVPHTNRDYFIDEIAECLAGRICEKIYTGDITSGASADLNNATQTAHAVVTELGMTSGTSERNLIFLNTEDHPMYSEKYINMINQEVEELISIAKSRAEEVIYSHKDLVKALVDALMENYIMSENQLDAICKQYL